MMVGVCPNQLGICVWGVLEKWPAGLGTVMIITCPECSTRYKTSDDAIGPNGRTVRCANCSSTWFVPAPEAQIAMDALTLADNQREDIAPTPTPSFAPSLAPSVVPVSAPKTQTVPRGAHVDIRDRADKRRRTRRLFGVAAIWLVPLAMLGTAAAGAYHFRQDIVSAHPQTATLYKALGINVSASGLILDPPEARFADIDGAPMLIVTGAARNISDTDLPLPRVALSLHNAGGERVAQWDVEMKTQFLPAGGRAEYLSQYPNPARDAVRLETRFAYDQVSDSMDDSATETPVELSRDTDDAGE